MAEEQPTQLLLVPLLPKKTKGYHQRRIAENMDPKRWKVSVAAVKSLYDIMHELEERYPELATANICSLDETNLTPDRRPGMVLAAKGARRTHTLCNEARFSMTCLPVVFADGSFIPPHFVVKGKKRPKWWGSTEFKARIESTEVAEASLSVQANGWVDTHIFLTWFEERFLPFYANRHSAATHIILIIDKFSGHVLRSTLHVAKDNHVIMIGLPHHSTHITQSLDVGLMKPLKDYWTRDISTLQVQNPWERYTEQDVIRLLCSPPNSLGTMPKGDRN
jgi:hypothetical protein